MIRREGEVERHERGSLQMEMQRMGRCRLGCDCGYISKPFSAFDSDEGHAHTHTHSGHWQHRFAAAISLVQAQTQSSFAHAFVH